MVFGVDVLVHFAQSPTSHVPRRSLIRFYGPLRLHLRDRPPITRRSPLDRATYALMLPTPLQDQSGNSASPRSLISSQATLLFSWIRHAQMASLFDDHTRSRVDLELRAQYLPPIC
ncbi:hypothetical protein BC629DRAFT_1596835 [Irpex lacteus]|nr:hypothetical protein BC629DRAFT_1596835 [Irpex lacteus]